MTARWSSTAKRAVALVRVGRAVSALRAARSDEARLLARRRLAELLGDARGIAMKVGQLAASDAQTDPLRSLVTSVDPIPLPQVTPELEASLAGSLQTYFAEVHESAAAASIGQVHKARLHDGRWVALKVRYPAIGDAIAAELAIAGLLPGVGPVRKWGFDLAGYKRVLAENMARELDYRDEAARQQEFARLVRVPGLVVPHVVEELCREGLLVQSWEAGARLSEARSFSKRDRLELGRVLVETLFVSLFGAGLVHADPHPGNYFFRPAADARRAEVVLLDFGSTVRVSAQTRLALLHLLVRTREGGAVDPLATFGAMGFCVEKLEPLSDALHELCAALFRPFLREGAFRVEDWQLAADFERTCGDLKWWFRAAGPPELLLLMRAFQGLCQHLVTLDVALPWWPILERAVSPDLLDQARAYRPPAVKGRPLARIDLRSRLLRVRIARGTDVLADVSMPAREAANLVTTVPEGVRVRIREKGVDLTAIQSDLLRRGFPPGEVFTERDGDDEWRVWLE